MNTYEYPQFYICLGVVLLLLLPITLGVVQMRSIFAFTTYVKIVSLVIAMISFGVLNSHYLTTWMSVCFFLLCEFYEVSGTYISSNRSQLMVLPDYGFDLIPSKIYYEISHIGKVKVEAIINLLLITLVGSAGLFLLFYGDGFLLLRRVFLMLGITALLRPLIFCMTSLPDPFTYHSSRILNQMEEEQKHEQYSLEEIINYTFCRLNNPQNIETRGDMLFSGHTRYLFTAVCAYASMITKENYEVYVPLFLAALSVSCFTCYLIIQCRFHYSVDIFMAIFIVVCLWTIINESAELAAQSASIKRLSLVCRVLVYFMTWHNL